eukprot:CAMPEP_0181220198 /NCGR_PEP_ID=MMETSP1096-20121128/28707_1 /TAXON_ID=156174 ORGANISM="Chrysochromulina ericina, Strain CCMP281" /NCGR_SAMPLE_ID=MMETSP1096 /ASSEMBLY_ACC=CAM_ASM_000453 /LENGTH=79 /DNA_ID=CAMNT_0023312681 /DNA_START=270 /DNA_END=509 /DNA_ORIENTATION=+
MKHAELHTESWINASGTHCTAQLTHRHRNILRWLHRTVERHHCHLRGVTIDPSFITSLPSGSVRRTSDGAPGASVIASQ